MKSRFSTGSKSVRSFDPFQVSTILESALSRDLHDDHTMYGHHSQASQFFKEVQVDKFLSKFGSSTTDESVLEMEAFEKFLSINSHIRSYNQGKLNLPKELTSPASKRDLILLRARSLCHWLLTECDEDEWFYHCKHSGGSSLGVPFSDTSLERKSTFPLTLAKRCVPLFERYLAFDGNLSFALKDHNRSFIGDTYRFEEESRATTVEKNAHSRRMIAVEPTVNMFFQQGLMGALVTRLSSVGLDLTSAQGRHRSLAREGSITGKLSTIDFSSASDCVSIELLRWLIPPSWFSKLDLVRSRRMNIRGESIELEMISTMGNATTFPIETLVFWSLAVSTARTVKGITRGNDQGIIPRWYDFDLASVFGDDCIVPDYATDDFIEITESVGFLVNHEKSFYGPVQEQPFRESCGGDYLRGIDVRPYFLKAPAGVRKSFLEPWLYTVFNGLLPKYMSYFGDLRYVYNRSIFEEIFRILNQNAIHVKIVPDWFPDDAGLKIGKDYFRFRSSYDFTPSVVLIDKHGTHRFKYLRFQYRNKRAWFEPLRYADHIKRWSNGRNAFSISETHSNVRKLEHMFNIRRIGGYVVATATTSHWEVNA